MLVFGLVSRMTREGDGFSEGVLQLLQGQARSAMAY